MSEPALQNAHRQVTFRLLSEKVACWRWLERVLDERRQLYNAALGECIDCYRKIGKSRTYVDPCRGLPRRRRYLSETAELSVRIRCGTTKRLDIACRVSCQAVENLGSACLPTAGPRLDRRRATHRLGDSGSGLPSETMLRLSWTVFQQPVMRKRANRLKDWQHKVSRKLADKAGTVVWEDLKCAGMTRSASGTVEAPGQRVAQKRGLKRSIRDTGWRGPLDKAAYEAFRTVLVPAACTSRTCNVCGHEERRNRPARARFECVACGHAEHADVNAARNIADRSIRAASGIGLVTRGDSGVSMTRQPPTGAGLPGRGSVVRGESSGGFTHAEVA